MKLKRIVISLGEDLINDLDKSNAYFSRAEFIRQSVKKTLEELKNKKIIKSYTEPIVETIKPTVPELREKIRKITYGGAA